jgi:prepilin-type N-terminal cleavage/methylation domain-containing protein
MVGFFHTEMMQKQDRALSERRKSKGFTLIELLVVIGIIGILAAVVLVAVNPSRQFALARDSQRRSHLYSIVNASYQYAVENNGLLPADITAVPTELGTCVGCVDLSDELVPTFIAGLPVNPTGGTAVNTGYRVNLDINGRMVATAASELGTGNVISVQR